MARLLGITRFWNYISDWIECRVHLRPDKDNALDLGSADFRWRTIYTGTAISARVYNSGAITHTSVGNFQTLTFDTERWDTDSIHSTVTNTARLTCNTAGVYLIIGMVAFAPDADGQRLLRIVLNDAVQLARVGGTANADGPCLIVSTLWNMAEGDYVTLAAYQNSGAALDMLYGSAYSPEFMMIRIV